jgi:hypothetical protein
MATVVSTVPGGRSVTVALGEATAQGYRIVDALQSAGGTPIGG